MAAAKRSKAKPAPTAPDAALKAATKGVKMVQNPAGFQEPDMDAARAANDESRFDGPNPFEEGTWRAECWARLKADSKK